MHALVIALILSTFTIEYLVRERELLHPYFVLVPDALSAIAVVLVFARIVSGARIYIEWRYLLLLPALILVMAFGFLLQEVPTGAIIAGIRSHLKFIPFFLLPLVYRFTPEQVRKQLIVILVLLLAETPLAFYQRFVEYAHMMHTGDPVRGTASTSSALSMLLICGIAGLVVAYLRKRITFARAVAMIGFLFLPTTINETKATLLLLPLAFLIPALFMPRGSKVLRRMLPIGIIGVFAAVVFIAAYDTLIENRDDGQSIGDFIGQRSFERYLYSGAAEEGANYIGRFDSLQFAMQNISKDPMRLAFGLGAANTSQSFLRQFNGEYWYYYDRYGVGMTQLTQLLWEVGLVGVAVYLLLYFCFFLDARLLARSNDEFSGLGQAWVAVVVIMTLALLYKTIFTFNEISYPLWYFSGLVASRAAMLRQARRSPARARHIGWDGGPLSRGAVPAARREAEAFGMKG
jgi:hypothetical protein